MIDTDAMPWSLYSGTIMPIEAYRWWIDPNGNDTGRVAMLAEDFGLPVGEPDPDDDSTIERTSLPGEFDFGDILHEMLLAPVMGCYYFEWSFQTDSGQYRLEDFAPIHPETIAHMQIDRAGHLEWIRQEGAVNGMLLGGALYADEQRITPDRLLPFVFWPDAKCRWTGRSLCRPMYRNWLCKDLLVRIDLTNHERAGGVPWISTDERWAGQDLNDLAQLAQEFRIDEEGGAALPPGATLNLARVAGSDTVASMRWHDEQMAQVWHSMVRQLGTTATGSRALGGTLGDLEALARRAIAEWARKTLNRWGVARWWAWNFGAESAVTCPVVRFTPPSLEAPSQETVDDALPVAGEGGPNPPRAATARSSPRNRQGAAAARDVESAARGSGPAAAVPPAAAASPRHRLPDRGMRRQPFEHEVAAAVDFAAIEAVFEDAADELDNRFLQDWLPEQIAALGDAILYTRRGTFRTRITAADMARVKAPVVGVDGLVDVLQDVVARGAAEAVAELTEQGQTVTMPTEAVLAALVKDHALAVARMIADGLSLAGSRRAVQMAASGLTPVALANDVADYLHGLAHVWERDQLAGAVTQAAGAGRLQVFEQTDQAATSFYISAMLDDSVCAPCLADDGREFATAAELRAQLPSGGNRDCKGGPRCRCIGVAVLVDEA